MSMRLGLKADRPLTNRQRQVLAELCYTTRRYGWTTPLGIGGSGHNNTSGVLQALIKKGLAERKPRGGLPAYIRGSYDYRATVPGLAMCPSD